MRLPGVERAVVDPAKVRDHLLSPDHPIGRAKARYFVALEFSRAAWPALQQALLDLATTADATPGHATPHRQKYEVRGMIQGPAGRAAAVVTVWIVLAGEDLPRLVTAYPGDAR